MTFLGFCKKMGNPNSISVSPDDRNVPEQYEEVLDATIKIMKPKMNIVDRISVPFIEKTFEKKPYIEICDELPNKEIPEGIINRLSIGLYDKVFNDLTDPDQQIIIKVLSVYIILSKK